MDVFYERDLIAPSKKEMYMGLFCWAMYLVGFQLILSLFGSVWEGDRGDVLLNVTFAVCNFILILCVFRRFLWRSRCGVGELIVIALWGYIAYYGITQLYSFLISFLPLKPVNANQQAVTQNLYDDRLSIAFLVIVLSPVIEEILVRGLIFAPLCKKSPLLGYIVSMAVFAFLHIMSYIGAEGQTFGSLLYSFLQYLPAGFILCWAYQRTCSILGSIVLHGVCNLVSVLMLLLL